MSKIKEADNFLDVVFDEEKYNSILRDITKIANNVEESLSSIADEGLVISLDFIEKVSKDESYFRDYVTGLENDYLKGVSFIPKDERARVKYNFDNFYDELAPSISKIRSAISNGITFKTDKSKIVVDYDSIDKRAREQSTFYTDVVEAEKYYNAIMALKQAQERLREYEIQNKLPNFLLSGYDGGLHYMKGDRLNSINFDSFCAKDCSKSLFSIASSSYFPKDKPKYPILRRSKRR